MRKQTKAAPMKAAAADTKKKAAKRLPVVAAALLCCSLLSVQCSKSAKASAGPHKFTTLLMGTIVEISIYGADEDSSKAAAYGAFELMRRLEKVFNPYDPKGELYALNHTEEGEPFAASADLCRIIKRSLEICRQTGRAFDPTFFALGIDFKDGQPHIPGEDVIKERLKLVDCGKVSVSDDCRITFGLAGMKIGLGGIAKGYIADRAAEYLKQRGFKDFIINAGGDMIVAGSKGNRPWRIGIKNPLHPGTTFAILEPKDRAIATSGNYHRFGKKDKKLWGHIIDPRTGKTASLSLSATVCARDLTTADAWATALFVMGEQGIERLNQIDGVEALLVTSERKIVKTRAFDDCAGLVSEEPVK